MGSVLAAELIREQETIVEELRPVKVSLEGPRSTAK
jgi:hypothetical protein